MKIEPMTGEVRDAAFRCSRLRLVFGPASTVAPLLRALADALEPLDLVPRDLDLSRSGDGLRLRVTCELAPSEPDLARALACLLRARSRRTSSSSNGSNGPSSPARHRAA